MYHLSYLGGVVAVHNVSMCDWEDVLNLVPVVDIVVSLHVLTFVIIGRGGPDVIARKR